MFVACADIVEAISGVLSATDTRAGHTGSGALIGAAAGLMAFGLVLAVAGHVLRRSP